MNIFLDNITFLRDKILSIEDFDEFAQILQHSDILDSAQTILNLFPEHTITPRIFLSCFFIYKFPDDYKETDIGKHLISISSQIINCSFTEFFHLISQFHQIFKNWKTDDRKILIEEIFIHYHKLTVELMNATQEDAINCLKHCKQGLIDTAYQLGGEEIVNEIRSYYPVVIDMQELGKSYNKAFWDVLETQYQNKDYSCIFIILEYIRNTLVIICPSQESHISEILDLEYIRERIRNDAYTPEELARLTLSILDIIKSYQSPQRDIELETLRTEIMNGYTYFPTIIQKILDLTEYIVQEIIDLQESLQ